MSRPLIPDVHFPEIPLLPGTHSLSIKPFGLMVALGVCCGVILAERMARARGIPHGAMSKFMYWVLVCAFVLGHVLDVVLYHPQHILIYPLTLLRLWDGLSSFGGFAGALLGVFLFKWRYRVKHVLPFVDIMGAAFPVGWTFGRLGCAIVHDHPGIRSDLWIAVAFRTGGRLDLGFCEMLFAAVIAIVCLVLARRPRPPGFFVGFTMLVYAPVRFAMDFLREAYKGDYSTDLRYLELTPAQWGSIAMAAAGFAFLWYAASSGVVGNRPFREATRGAHPSLLGYDADESSPPAT